MISPFYLLSGPCCLNVFLPFVISEASKDLLPHYQAVKDDVLDGLRVFQDIAYPDSVGKTFYAIPDGSYLFIGPGREELRGEAYRIRDGAIAQVASDGDIVML